LTARAGRYAGRVARALAVSLAGFALLEGVARVWPAPDPAQVPAVDPEVPAILLHGNPMLLWELVPGTRTERGVQVHVNGDGFRGPERGPRAGPRALAVGDSSVYGFGVEDTAVWSAVAERALGAEVINGACPGWSSYQARNMLDLRGWALEPDLLVVANLWSDNTYDGFVDRELLASHAGWQLGWTRRARGLLERSEAFRRADWELRVRPRGERARAIGWDLSDDDPRVGTRRVPIAEYVRNLEAMVEDARAHGAGVVFVGLANREDLRAGTGSGTGVPEPAWAPYRAAMRSVAARHGAPLVDVVAAFRASGASADALFLDQMHPTALGHRRIAEAFVDTVRGIGWPAARWRLPAPSGEVPRVSDPFAAAGGRPPTTHPP
jgi:hypothetical protein